VDFWLSKLKGKSTCSQEESNSNTNLNAGIFLEIEKQFERTFLKVFSEYSKHLSFGEVPLQVSACSTFLMMCDVPSMAVFVGNVLSVILVLFPDIFVNFCL
jgi:hypothetical protein